MSEYTLYYSPTSPYVRKPMMMLHEFGAVDRVKLISNASPDFKNPSPLKKVPALQTPDMGLLFDSPVICEYIDYQFGKGAYFSAEPKKRFETLYIQALADGIMDAGVTIVLETRRPADKQIQQTIDHQAVKVFAGLDELQSRLPSFAQGWDFRSVCAATIIGYVKFRTPQYFDVNRFAALEKWWNSIADRPSVKYTAPKIPA